MEPQLIEQLVNVNLLSSYYMTKLVLPNMIKKKKGLILYTSSGVTSLKSCPLYTIYGSVKDAICSFANSLSVELKEYNIQVQCHVPLFIVTKLSKIKNPGIFVPTSDIYAKCAIQKMREVIFDIVTLEFLKIVKSKIVLKNLKSYGDTIIITGCTDGIGKSLTYSLINQNVNLLLISRNESELKNMKRDLLEKNKNYKGTIEYITFDYNANDFNTYKIIEAKIRSMDIGILINNVGVSYPYPLV
ncbi:hypothetical protein PFFCH_05146 [Plasmodium falciparum FCH/4]|uniref:Tyrosine specific protein phosphatases domain-containing protein n=1 Tax=Plasmodium falciparum FCH/4 TaxID=1036724 RepID=A0A024VF80_PLAFA|nr:hypothetical protein PFFCH_05146 [Plasmodium falciparum FCH/4]